MRFLTLALLLAAGPMLAQDRDADTAKLLEMADQLERQAEKLLDQGRKAQALELLAKAADAREAAAKLTAGKAKREAADRAAARDRAELERARAEVDAQRKAKAKREAKRKADRKRDAGAPGPAKALAAMRAALEAGDLKTAAEAGRTAHKLLVQWERGLERRERKLRQGAGGAPGRIEQRVAALEKQVAELRRLLDAPR